MIRLNMWKVRQMCESTPVPEIYGRSRWDTWTKELDDAGRALGVNWAVGPTREQIPTLREAAHNRGYYVVGYNGYPYSYPFNRVLVPRAELYQNGNKIGAINIFITYSDVGPLLSSVAGGGNVYSCSEEYKNLHNLAAYKQIGFVFIPIKQDIAW